MLFSSYLHKTKNNISRNYFEFATIEKYFDWLILEMRFELCGGIEVPNWIVFQLTKISKENNAQKIREISKIATKLLKIDHKDSFDEEIKHYLTKHAEEISVILYLYKSTNRFNITEDLFQRQLQLFGLSPEVIVAIVTNTPSLESKIESNIRVMN